VITLLLIFIIRPPRGSWDLRSASGQWIDRGDTSSQLHWSRKHVLEPLQVLDLRLV